MNSVSFYLARMWTKFSNLRKSGVSLRFLTAGQEVNTPGHDSGLCYVLLRKKSIKILEEQPREVCSQVVN